MLKESVEINPKHLEMENEKKEILKNFETKHKLIYNDYEEKIKTLDRSVGALKIRNQVLTEKLKDSQHLTRSLREMTQRMKEENRNLILGLMKMLKLYQKFTPILLDDYSIANFVTFIF